MSELSNDVISDDLQSTDTPDSVLIDDLLDPLYFPSDTAAETERLKQLEYDARVA